MIYSKLLSNTKRCIHANIALGRRNNDDEHLKAASKKQILAQ